MEDDEDEEDRDTDGSLRVEAEQAYQQCKSTRITKKPELFDPQKGFLAFSQQEVGHLASNLDKMEIEAEPMPKGFTFKAINPDTGELNEYSKLARSSDGHLWITAMCNKIGRLFQGYFPTTGKQIQGTNTCKFIKVSELPTGKKATYVRIVTADRPVKEEQRQVRMTVGGDQVNYPGDCATKGADLVTAKCLFNSVMSTDDTKFMNLDVKDFYLGTILPNIEYIRIPVSIIPDKIMQDYQLQDLIHDEYLYTEVSKGMYGLPQAGRIANDELLPRLAAGGYREAGHTPGLFKHDTNSIIFCLIVDDFGVKYTKKQDAEHLRDLLKTNYTITEDWKGKNFIGLNLKWDHENRTVDLSIKGYVQKAFQQFEHEKPKRPQHAPNKWTAPQYGAAIQMAEPEDQSPPLDAPCIKFLMKVVGTFLYYARAVDMTMQVALGSIVAAQSKGTEATMDAAIHLLNYAATHPDATLRFTKSNMKLHIVSGASYASEPKARSRVGGYFYLDGKEDPQPGKPPKLNGAIHVESRIMKNVMASAAEAEIRRLIHQRTRGNLHQKTSYEEMGHPQDGPTTIITDNSTATRIRQLPQ